MNPRTKFFIAAGLSGLGWGFIILASFIVWKWVEHVVWPLITGAL